MHCGSPPMSSLSLRSGPNTVSKKRHAFLRKVGAMWGSSASAMPYASRPACFKPCLRSPTPLPHSPQTHPDPLSPNPSPSHTIRPTTTPYQSSLIARMMATLSSHPLSMPASLMSLFFVNLPNN